MSGLKVVVLFKALWCESSTRIERIMKMNAKDGFWKLGIVDVDTAVCNPKILH